MASNTFVGPGGQDPLRYIDALIAASTPTVGDCLYAGQILRSRIYQRTMQGQDASGGAFVAYSDSYAKAKTRKLGHTRVDLFSAEHHPHMLNAMIVRAGNQEVASGTQGILDFSYATERAPQTFYLGFYGEEAARARINHEGGRVRTRLGKGAKPDSGFGHGVMRQKKGGKPYATVPARPFFTAAPDDLTLMGEAIMERIQVRQRRTR